MTKLNIFVFHIDLFVSQAGFTNEKYLKQFEILKAYKFDQNLPFCSINQHFTCKVLTLKTIIFDKDFHAICDFNKKRHKM